MDATLPSQLIQTDQDLVHWLKSDGCRGYQAWIKTLSKKIEGVSFSSAQAHLPPPSQTILDLEKLLSHLKSLTSQHPPLHSAQRYGNLAFRTYFAQTTEDLPSLITTLLEPTSHLPLLPQLLPLLQNTSAFGSSTRLDYGTGHEAAFFLFLYALRVGGVLKEEDDEWVALRVFRSYLELVWTLQDLYKLEPAGSHGVWGLDDYCFLPYVFGSSQLLPSTTITPESILPPPSPRHALPGSSAATIEATSTYVPPLRKIDLDAPESPPTRRAQAPGAGTTGGQADDFYSMAIRRIGRIKSGNWYEHSPLLYNLATSGKSWAKIHSGLLKMYEGEVLGKRVVVQHLFVGGPLVGWEISSTS
ncbi:hypothetical protein BDY24DRAFT_134039 [Mrakia frigida]|uniref:serine/threonine-protein phosphatase 2A activator n=1 Tax=Mrakia frigida TaxID=29902 RepID=UPI003FCC06DA